MMRSQANLADQFNGLWVEQDDGEGEVPKLEMTTWLYENRYAVFQALSDLDRRRASKATTVNALNAASQAIAGALEAYTQTYK